MSPILPLIILVIISVLIFVAFKIGNSYKKALLMAALTLGFIALVVFIGGPYARNALESK